MAITPFGRKGNVMDAYYFYDEELDEYVRVPASSELE